MIFSGEEYDLFSLQRAYRIIFSVEKKPDLNKLRSLELSVVKSAFRLRAFETHPDRSHALGVDTALLMEQFKNVNSAYRELKGFLGRERNQPRNIYKMKKNTKGHQRKQNTAEAMYRKNNLPQMELLLGQYLYYTGIISFKVLLEAVQWQRRQRAMFGSIALEWSILTHSDIATVLRNVRYREKFGDCALRLGLLNSFQHRAILSRQRQSQSPIGEYFIKKRLLTQKDLDDIVRKLRLHNFSIRKRASSA